MLLNKWNYKTHKYDKVQIPDCYNCKTYSNNMKELVHCPHCGDELEFGDSYTSLEYHTEMGFGYAVCEACYELEWERRNKLKADIEIKDKVIDLMEKEIKRRFLFKDKEYFYKKASE